MQYVGALVAIYTSARSALQHATDTYQVVSGLVLSGAEEKCDAQKILANAAPIGRTCAGGRGIPLRTAAFAAQAGLPGDLVVHHATSPRAA